MRTFKYTRLTTKPDGHCTFVDETLTLDQHPKTEQAFLSEPIAADCLKTLLFKAGTVFEEHNAPCRQFIFQHQGTLEVTTSEGDTRRINVGDVVLVENTSGRGHVTKVVGEQDVLITVCPLKNQD